MRYIRARGDRGLLAMRQARLREITLLSLILPLTVRVGAAQGSQSAPPRSTVSRKTLDYRFHYLDADRNGKIDRAEFDQRMPQLMKPARKHQTRSTAKPASKTTVHSRRGRTGYSTSVDSVLNRIIHRKVDSAVRRAFWRLKQQLNTNARRA